jgi:hypothetical protein
MVSSARSHGRAHAKRMKLHPGKRVFLDGFPRSRQNTGDLVTLCGKPEMALHLTCDVIVLLLRIMHRGRRVRDINDPARPALSFARSNMLGGILTIGPGG